MSRSRGPLTAFNLGSWPLRSPMLRVLLKLAISAALIWLLIRGLDVGALTHEILAVDRPALILGLALSELTLLVVAFRWSSILRAIGHPMRFRVTLSLTLVGQFFSQVLPTSIGGDVMRMFLARRAGLSGQTSFSSVLVDRATGVLALCLVSTAALPLLAHLIPDRALLGSVVLVLAGVFAGMGVAMMLDFVPERFRRFRVVEAIAGLASDLRRTLLTTRWAVLTMTPSIASQLAQVAVVAVLGGGLGLGVSYLDCLAIVPLATLATLLPISIGGWGLREGVFVVGFSLAGIGRLDAIAMSVLLGVLNALASLPGGVIWLGLQSGTFSVAKNWPPVPSPSMADPGAGPAAKLRPEGGTGSRNAL